MKTAVSISDPVFQNAEQLAKRLKMSRSRLYAAAVAEYVNRHRAADITNMRRAVCGMEMRNAVSRYCALNTPRYRPAASIS